MSTPVTDWTEMNAFQRNWLVGEVMKAEPLRAYYVRRDGKDIAQLRVKDEGEAQSWLRIANMSLTNWVKLMPEVPYESRAEVTIHVDSWHVRYSDTPGGGWVVVEWLRKQGPVNIASVGDGWRVAFGDDAETAPTMAEAACLIALRTAA